MMTFDRFSHLTDAYGADLKRWPEGERAKAQAFLNHDARARLMLDDAAMIDGLLDAAPRPVVSAEMRRSVVEAASYGALKRRGRGLSWSRLAWLSGAGWAAAAFAGMAFGLSLTGSLTLNQRADAVLYQASLNAADDTEVLGE